MLVADRLDDIKKYVCMPVKRVYNDCVQAHYPEVHVDAIPSFSKIKSRLDRYRCSLNTEIPRTIDDVLIVGEWTETWNNELFMVVSG